MSDDLDLLGGDIHSREEVKEKIGKADTVQKVGFTAQVGSIPTVFKADGEFVIWGPASVEVVDKEGDLIEASALSDALPQLLKRARLSLEHSDQLVGKIIERFETDEPVTVNVNGESFERTEFPTDVMNLDGIEPALYVSGKIWDDTRQARETRRKIENGEIDSYSISGEALVTRTKVDDGDAYDEIVDMDLSAVTLCEEGMNQHAKFGIVTGDTEQTAKGDEVSVDDTPDVSADSLQSVAKSAVGKTMSNQDNDGSALDLETVEAKFEEVIQESLPDGELATKDDVEDTVNDLIEQQDRASEQDDTDDEGTTNYRHEDVQNPFDRGFSPAVVERMVDKITEKIEEEYGLEKEPNPAEEHILALANEYDMEPEEVRNTLSGKEGGEVPPEFQEDGEDEEDDEEMPDMEDDEKGDMPDEEEEEEMPPMDDEDDGAMEYSAEELERQLPDDVYEVVSEYIEASEKSEKSDTDDSTDDEDLSKSEIQDAVEEVLKGDGINKSDGVEGATAATGESPEPSFEKGEDQSSTGGHPALAQIYEDGV